VPVTVAVEKEFPMSASTHNPPRYYGGLFNLEHRVMSGAVFALAVIVLVLFGQEGRAVPSSLGMPLEPPAADALNALDGERDGWMRPAEIRVHSPAVSHPILDERLLQRFRLLEPPKSAPPPVRRVTTTDAQLIVVPARPAGLQVGPPDVAALRLGESLVPGPARSPVAPGNG
jgi:hypothetical protein